MESKSFTLIELLVSLTVFIFIITGILGILIAGMRQQNISLSMQTVIDQTSFALELMSRALRMATEENGQRCLSQAGFNYEITRDGRGIKFINSMENNDCQEFFVDRGQLKYWKRSTGQELPLTSEKLEITSFNLNIIGASEPDLLQPRLTFFLAIQGRASGVPKINIQTTISSRNLDVIQ